MPLRDILTGEEGCPYWKDTPPPLNKCNGCLTVFMLCFDEDPERCCPDYDRCFKSGMPKTPQLVRNWISDWADFKNMNIPLPGIEFAKNHTAFQIISSEQSEIDAEKIREMTKPKEGK